MRNPRSVEDRCNRLVCTNPRGEYWLGRGELLSAIPSHAISHRVGKGRRRSNRGLHIYDEHGIAFGIGKQDIERGQIALCIGVAGDIDGIGLRPSRRQHGV